MAFRLFDAKPSIILINAALPSIGATGSNFCETLIETQQFAPT